MPNLQKVQDILNETVSLIARNIMTDEVMLSEASKTETGVMTFSAVSLVLGILLAWIIARGIIGPLQKGMEFAATVSTGDLTATVDLEQDDEVGQLASSLTDMADKLNGVVGDVNSATDSVSAGSEELSASAQSLSQSVTEQAASIEQVPLPWKKWPQACAPIRRMHNRPKALPTVLRAMRKRRRGRHRGSGSTQIHCRTHHHHSGNSAPDQPAGTQRRH